MKGDYLTYQNAAWRCIIGLVIQVAMTLLLLIYGVKFNQHVVVSAAIMVGLGCLVWLTLAIVFDQHRRERVEALEAETISQQQGGSVFEGSSDDFKVAARRLATMTKVLLPAMSLVFGVSMIGVGVLRLLSGKTLVDPSAFVKPPDAWGWALGLGITLGFVGFVFARYTAGMAKQAVWAGLRAGSGQAVAASLFGFALAIATFMNEYGSDTLLRYMQVLVPVGMIVLGVETLLNFLLDLYRPRKAGEVARSAFDSRLLSFVAAPDRIAQSISEAINYQFGYNVSSTWLYQLLARWVALLVLVGVGLTWLLTGLAVVEPHQRGLLLRWGQIKGELGPGMHLKYPWPIDRVLVPEYQTRDAKGVLQTTSLTTTGLRTLHLATPPAADQNPGPILWTNEHATNEVYFIVRPSALDLKPSGRAASGEDETTDIALIAMEIPLMYAVRDVEKYERLGSADQVPNLLRAVGQREVMLLLSGYTIDEVLGADRVELASLMRDRVAAAFERLNPGPDGKPMGSGVEVISVNVSAVHPHQSAAPAFERVVQQQQASEAQVEIAKAEAGRALTEVVGSEDRAKAIVAEIDALEAMRAANKPEAEIKAQELKIQEQLDKATGKAAAALAEAKAQRWARHMSERGRAFEYSGMIDSYLAAPRVFMAQMYFDALREAMSQSRVFITDDSIRLDIRANLEDKELGGAIFEQLDSESQ